VEELAEWVLDWQYIKLMDSGDKVGHIMLGRPTPQMFDAQPQLYALLSVYYYYDDDSHREFSKRRLRRYRSIFVRPQKSPH
jgi:hypothetical protein